MVFVKSYGLICDCSAMLSLQRAVQSFALSLAKIWCHKMLPCYIGGGFFTDAGCIDLNVGASVFTALVILLRRTTYDIYCWLINGCSLFKSSSVLGYLISTGIEVSGRFWLGADF
jgi:hypothetical protein